MKIGQKIKELRTRQRITLKELAKKTGLTASFFSQLERNLTSPSVTSLEKIAQALDNKVSYFFDSDERKELVFIKTGTGRKFLDEDKNVFCEELVSGLFTIKMKPQVFTLRTGAELKKELIYSKGECFGMVVKGRIKFHFSEEELIFEEGDSIYCAYTQRLKKVKNAGDTEARLLWIVFDFS